MNEWKGWFVLDSLCTTDAWNEAIFASLILGYHIACLTVDELCHIWLCQEMNPYLLALEPSALTHSLLTIQFQARRHGGHFGAVPPQMRNVSPCEEWAPWKVTGSVPLECSSGPESLKTLDINPVFVGNNRFFCRFCDDFFFCLVYTQVFVKFRAFFATKTFFMVFTLELEGKSFCVPPKIVYAPIFALLLRQACSIPLISNFSESIPYDVVKTLYINKWKPVCEL